MDASPDRVDAMCVRTYIRQEATMRANYQGAGSFCNKDRATAGHAGGDTLAEILAAVSLVASRVYIGVRELLCWWECWRE